MTERLDLKQALLAERRKLAELRALRERVSQRRLEDDDWAVVSALASEAIEEAEPGQEWVVIEGADGALESRTRRPTVCGDEESAR